jgi:hypothetical protein
MNSARVRITVERFDVQPAGTDNRYITEVGNEKLLITCAPPDAVGLALMKEQVLACLGGYQPEQALEGVDDADSVAERHRKVRSNN